jgi:cysteine synthase A
MPQADRDWIAKAVEIIEADFNRSADTCLLRAAMPPIGVSLYLKSDVTLTRSEPVKG